MLLDIALLNIQGGWSRTGFDFHRRFPLVLADVQDPPALWLFNEAVDWDAKGGRGRYAAARALRDLYDTPYVVETGWLERSPHPPAIVYDPTRLILRSWTDAATCATPRDRNRAEFDDAVAPARPDGLPALAVSLHHFDYADGTTRMAEAKRMVARVRGDVPYIGAGDFNGAVSGPQFPDKDWETLVRTQPHKRYHKSWQPAGLGTPFVADTRAMDILLGPWDEELGTRHGPRTLFALAEDDWIQRGRPDELLTPTTNTGADAGGSLVIDQILRNHRVGLVEGTYRVHVPASGQQVSDHRLVTATITL